MFRMLVTFVTIGIVVVEDKERGYITRSDILLPEPIRVSFTLRAIGIQEVE